MVQSVLARLRWQVAPGGNAVVALLTIESVTVIRNHPLFAVLNLTENAGSTEEACVGVDDHQTLISVQDRIHHGDGLCGYSGVRQDGRLREGCL